VLSRLIAFSVAQRWLVVLATAAMAGLGILNFNRLPIDAVPDITNVQVQINTAIQSLSPVEVEKRITFPIEWAMGGVPGVERVRSLSRYGLSQVTVIFADGTDISLRPPAREPATAGGTCQPAGRPGRAGHGAPIAAGLGEIFMWSVEARNPARRARRLPRTP
jgi:cobalt-zinc-cadmium resistance protein CzcA